MRKKTANNGEKKYEELLSDANAAMLSKVESH